MYAGCMRGVSGVNEGLPPFSGMRREGVRAQTRI